MFQNISDQFAPEIQTNMVLPFGNFMIIMLDPDFNGIESLLQTQIF